MSNQQTPRLRLQIQFNWKIALCVLFMVSILMQLGFWQLDRAEQKRQVQNNRNAQRLANPVAIEFLNLDNKGTLDHRKVILKGDYNHTKSLLIANQMFQGRPGYEVMTVFNLHPSDQIVLVSRGWISADYNGQLPAIPAITAVQQLVGEIHVPSEKSFFLPQKIDDSPVWPLRVHHFVISDIGHLLDKPILPFIVRLDQNSVGVLKRHWRVKRLPARNSTSYALQWFGMALILIVITIIKSTNILKIIRLNKSTQ